MARRRTRSHLELREQFEAAERQKDGDEAEETDDEEEDEDDEEEEAEAEGEEAPEEPWKKAIPCGCHLQGLFFPMRQLLVSITFRLRSISSIACTFLPIQRTLGKSKTWPWAPAVFTVRSPLPKPMTIWRNRSPR